MKLFSWEKKLAQRLGDSVKNFFSGVGAWLRTLMPSARLARALMLTILLLTPLASSWGTPAFAQPAAGAERSAPASVVTGEAPAAAFPLPDNFKPERVQLVVLSFPFEVVKRARVETGPGIYWNVDLRPKREPETGAIAWSGLEVRGDWLRVRHHHPGQFFWLCGHGNREAWAGQTREGWVKWWSPDKGTWLWYPTRGC